MRIYISGQMAGLGEKEYAAKFNAAEKKLRSEGHEPINPVTVAAYGLDYDKSMEVDKILLESCNAVYMLDNWKESRGARQERNHAMELGLDVRYENQPPWNMFVESLCSRANNVAENVRGIRSRNEKRQLITDAWKEGKA